jgi:hypothetical protein
MARPEVTGAKTRETELTKDEVFDAVVLVDGVGRPEIERVMPDISRLLTAKGIEVEPAEAAVYDMAYCLEPTG